MNSRLLSAGLLGTLGIAMVVAGCSSKVGDPVPTYGSATPPALQTASVTFTVIPGSAGASSARRRPAYLSAGTQSVSILPIVVGSPNQTATIINLGDGLTGCTGSGAKLACTGNVLAPIGETTFTVTTYGGRNAQGSVLSTGPITVDVKAKSTETTLSNATTLTLSGVPASFSLAVNPPNITLGVPSVLSAVVTSVDAAGDIIIGASKYETGVDIETIVPNSSGNDVVLTSSFNGAAAVPGCAIATPDDTTCNIVSVVTQPAEPISLTYAGEFVAGTAIAVAGESPGLVPQSVPISISTPTAPPIGSTPGPQQCIGSPIVVCPASIIFYDSNSAPVTVTAMESSGAAIIANASTCFTSQIAFINNGQTATGTSFTVEPGTVAGSCSMFFQDPLNNITNLPVTNLSGAPSPSPSPTPVTISTGTPVPVGPITISPSNTIVFTSSTAPPATFTASEAGITSFTIDQKACAGIATTSPAAGTSFTVTPVSTLTQGGKCTLDVVDPSGQMSAVGIDVDGVSFVINKKR